MVADRTDGRKGVEKKRGVATHIKLTFNRTLICLADFVDGAIENGPSIEEGPLCCLKDFR
jgi:hypothetical protein